MYQFSFLSSSCTHLHPCPSAVSFVFIHMFSMSHLIMLLLNVQVIVKKKSCSAVYTEHFRGILWKFLLKD